MNCECLKGVGTALMTMLSVSVVANPLQVQTYEQTFKVKFADAEAAKRVECVMTRLPGDAKVMLSSRWDDSNPNHVAKTKMLKEVGVRPTIYANYKPEFLKSDAKKIMELGGSIGNHTMSHPFMMEISANRDFSEILLNRINIETNLDASCISFAAPYGWCAAIDDAKPVLVSDILFNTGHYVSGDNVIPETKGGEKKRYPTRLVRSGDSKTVPEKVAQSFKSALDWIAENPHHPRMSYGIHSWCDAAGNALQAQTIRDAWQDDWCTGTDAEYGAYSYQYDYGKIVKTSVNGDVAEFKVTRFDPRPLGSVIPMSLKFSETPKETSLEAGLRGTYLLPHDSSRKIVTKIGMSLSEKFPKISVKFKLLGDDQLLVGLRNDSGSRLDDIYGVVMLPPKWKNGRVIFAFPPLESGADINLAPILLEPADRKDYAYGPADYACSIDFNQNGEACRIWALTKDEGVKPPEQLMPAQTVKSIGVFDVAKLDAEACRAMSVPGAELKDLGPSDNEKWGLNGKLGGSGCTVFFWPDFTQHPKSRLAYRDTAAKLIEEKKQARLFAYDFIAEQDGPAKLYASTDRGLPKVTPVAWLNGESVKLGREVVNPITVKKGVNRIILRLDMVQTRWPESALLVVCRDGLDTPFPAYAAPVFQWRGFMLDEARHFFGKETVKKVLDRMFELRLNRFHWHLTDDQGWRLDLPGMPELVKYGAKRSSSPIRGADGGSDGKEYGPFYYTATDVKEIVEYAAKRGIVVVPEIELPGHTRALLAAHPEFACEGVSVDRNAWCEYGVCKEVICAGKDDVIRYYERIFDEVMKMFPGEHIHIGGDECPKDQWKKCPKCQARIKAENLKDEEALQGWITRHMVEYISKKGRRAIGWDEILEGGDLPKGTIIQSWRGVKGGKIAAEKGYDVIMSPCDDLYFSIPESVDSPYPVRRWVREAKKTLPASRVRAFDPLAGIPSECASRILGAECCAWSEEIHSPDELRYKCHDRLGAFSEALRARQR